MTADPNHPSIPDRVKNAKTRVLRGRRAVLRPLSRDHVGERYVRWLNDSAINRYLESRFEVHDIRSVGQFVDRSIASGDVLAFAIHLADDDTYVGNIKLGPIDAHQRMASVGFLIGEASVQRQGLASEAVRLVTDFAFAELALEKLTAGAYVVNRGSIRVFDKAGWSQEAVRRKHKICDGHRIDVIEFGVLAEEWGTRS